jgi:SAM-dependent methyltransferase
MEPYFAGAALWGDEFSEAECGAWFADEADASIDLDEDLLRGEYRWAEQQRRHVFARLPQTRWRHVVGFGSAFGVELKPLRAERATIIEATSRYEATPGLSFPLEYVMAQPSGDINLPDGCADLVICFGTLHHVPNVSHVLQEFGRIVETGGYLALVEPITSMGDWRQPRPNLTPRERGLPLDWARRAICGAGFAIENEALFGFAPIRIAGRLMKGSPYNSWAIVALDEKICRVLRRRVKYHTTSKIEKTLRPKSAAWIARRVDDA